MIPMRALFPILALAVPTAAQERPWSWRPLVPPTPPAGSADHPIDAFVDAALESRSLRRSPPAPRAVALRRLVCDLTGLPPTPERLTHLLADEHPAAWERAVDALLADPGFGEAWARHWLDVARYADTHGFDKDKVRAHAWPYRDWVVRALNDGVPFARFARWQIAGDVLAPHEPDAVRATGFVAAGPWDYVGHVELREGTRDKRITRNLDRDEMLTGVASAFLGATVHCARCHDHPFDPIPQRDYYALQAAFAGIERAERPLDPDRATAERRRNLALALDAARAARDRADHAPPAAALASERAWFEERARLVERLAQTAPPARTSTTNGYHGPVATTRDTEQWVEVHLDPPRPLALALLWPARPVDFPDTPGFGFPHRWRLEVERDGHPGEAHVVRVSAAGDDADPGDHPVAVLLDGTPLRRVRVVATALRERRGDYVFALAELELFACGGDPVRPTSVAASGSIEAGLWSHAFLVDGATSHHRLDDPVLRDRARLAELDARCATVLATGASDDERAERATLRARHAELEAEWAALPARTPCYALATAFAPEGRFTPPPDGPRAVHVLARGDVDRPLERVHPAGLTALAPELSAAFPPQARDDDGAARAALAQWITDERNPLFWRAGAQRVWQHLIGRPLIDTPNDFGHMGATPTHPELLDWLAAELRDGDGSWKELAQRVVTSATYRQTAASHPRGEAVDASNRFLWRMHRKRRSAEAVRDAILQQAQRLDRTTGGPGFRAFLFEDDHSPRYLYERHDPLDPRTARRSIYRFVVRSVRSPFLEALDDPDPCSSVGRRDETLTALQALTLLNHPFVLAQAHALETHLARGGSSGDGALLWLHRTILLRDPRADERAALGAYLAAHGVAATARVLWNTNEFLYVD